jgi:ribosomal protein S18 acetylase RimI-like enzyme
MTNIKNLTNQTVKFIYFNSDDCNCKNIVEFFQKIDHDFVPPLSSKVNIVDWSKKLVEKAVNIVAIVEKHGHSEIIGIISFYCNDYVKLYSYIPVIGILNEYRGKGIASILWDMCLKHLKEKGFKLVGIRTWESSKAFSIYKKIGFQEINNIVDSENQVNKIYMEMQI